MAPASWDINNYYNGALGYGKVYPYSHTRSAAGLVPGAPTVFTATGTQAILPMTVDFFSSAANGYLGVGVISGFTNQCPWASGRSLWPGQAGFSRHYYTGGWSDISPAAPFANSANQQTTRHQRRAHRYLRIGTSQHRAGQRVHPHFSRGLP